jgi:hypothetical protein
VAGVGAVVAWVVGTCVVWVSVSVAEPPVVAACVATAVVAAVPVAAVCPA